MAPASNLMPAAHLRRSPISGCQCTVFHRCDVKATMAAPPTDKHKAAQARNLDSTSTIALDIVAIARMDLTAEGRVVINSSNFHINFPQIVFVIIQYYILKIIKHQNILQIHSLSYQALTRLTKIKCRQESKECSITS